MCNTVRDICAVKDRHGRFGSTLEMDLRHKNKKIGFYPKSLRKILRILFVVDDSQICMQNEFLWMSF